MDGQSVLTFWSSMLEQDTYFMEEDIMQPQQQILVSSRYAILD